MYISWQNTKFTLKYTLIFVILGYQENFLRTQKRIQISHGKQTIGIQVIEGSH